MKIFSFLVIYLALLQLASSQEQDSCTVPLSALQCSRNQPVVVPQSLNRQGLPGKRGAPGIKGEKGESGNHHDIAARFTKFTRRLDSIEAELDPIEELCDRSEIESLRAALTATEGKLAASVGEIESLRANLTAMEAKLSAFLDDMDTLRSCSDVPMKRQHRTNGSYTIKPNDSTPPFVVDCKFIGSTVITSVGHDSEGEVEVTCETHRCHKRIIQYEATVQQMRGLIELTGNCRQFIKYRCHHSSMFQKGNEYAGWLSWDGRLQTYWGGADRQPNYCACGVAGNCATSTNKCNCDSNDNVEREDSGYLTYQDDLPVHTLFFGDTGSGNEYGFHTLGKLECFG